VEANRRVAAVLGGLCGAAVSGSPAGGRGIVYRYRTGVAWRDLPEEFGPWQTVWKRHRRFSVDGTWDRLLTRLLADADAAGDIDWTVSVDSTINRAHQHAATLPRHTGGTAELHETPGRAR
jgi:transposase